MRRLPWTGVVGSAIALVLACTPAAAQRVSERFGDRAALRSGATTVPQTGASVRPVPGADSTRSRGVAGELLLGTVGSAVGFWGGAALGVLYYDTFEHSCGCEDPGQGEAIVGALAGSIVGTALGTQFGARADGGRGGHLGKRIGGAFLGLLAASGVVTLISRGGDSGALPLAVFPFIQAAVTTLLSPRQ